MPSNCDFPTKKKLRKNQNGTEMAILLGCLETNPLRLSLWNWLARLGFQHASHVDDRELRAKKHGNIVEGAPKDQL